MNYVVGQDRDQMMIISLEQMVHTESYARIIDAYVETLNFKKLGFDYYQLKKEGRPPFHPSVLLKLYLYGYQKGVRSCRKLEDATRVNLEVMWLIKGLHPHYKTISNFRKNNSVAFRNVFRSFVALLKE
jgi:transposase